jgi:hypothetical protein
MAVFTLQQGERLAKPLLVENSTSEFRSSTYRDDDIALLAVEQLGSLAARLLSRTELSNSAHQVPLCVSCCCGIDSLRFAATGCAAHRWRRASHATVVQLAGSQHSGDVVQLTA